MHVVDAALMYAELERAGALSQADIARQYRKSAGYVSILCRLGHALRPLLPAERAALRVPHVTFKAAQAAVSRERDATALRRALAALAASHPALRRRRMAASVASWREPLATPPDQAPLDPLPLSAAEAAARHAAWQADFRFRWDEDAARQDPAGVLAAYEAFVRASTATVIDRLRRLAAAPTSVASAVSAAPDHASRREAAGARDAAPARAPLGWELSLRQLDARVGATLSAHRARMAAFLADRQTGRPLPSPRGILAARSAAGGVGGAESGVPGRGGTLPPISVPAEDVEADLAE